MKSIKFPQVNTVIGAEQPEYEPVNAYVGNIGAGEVESTGVIVCYQLDEEEVQSVLKHGKIWYSQLTFGAPMHPMYLDVREDIFSTEPTGKVEPITVTDVAKLSFMDKLMLLFGGSILLTKKVKGIVVETLVK